MLHDYARLKRDFAEKYRANRRKCTDSKAEFVNAVLNLASA